MMKRILAAVIGLALSIGCALAQIPGNSPSGGVFANPTATNNIPGRWSTANAWLNRWCSSTSGRFPLNNAGTWACATISGDATISGSGALTLATVNSNVGSFGSSTNCVTITVNAKGLITAASQTACSSAAGVASLNTLTGALVLSATEQLFTATGGYTPTAGTIFSFIRCKGSGGGGGSAQGTVSETYSGSGGGSGSYCEKTATAAQLAAAAPITVTVNNGGAGGVGATPTNGSAGGAVTFGSLCTTNGGSGGGLTAKASSPGTGGAGGTVGSGDLVIAGEPGLHGIYSANATVAFPSGNGGSGFAGGGGLGVSVSGTATAGNAGTKGGGGSGAHTNSTASTANGGAGGNGFCAALDYTLN